MRPTGRSALMMVAGLPLAALPALTDGRLWLLWLSYLALVLLLMGIDSALAQPRRRIGLEPRVPEQLFIGRDGTLDLELEMPGRRPPRRLELLLEVGPLLLPPSPRFLTLEAGREVVAAFPLKARRRGTATLDRLWLRWRGPLGLIQCVRQFPLEREVPVVPDIQSVRRAALSFFGSKEFLAGLKREEYSGDGSEFDRLREFVPGLDHRAIDWKASARHCKLLSREFRAERNHQVVIAIDTGHLMREAIGGIPKLDHAINAGLLLCWYSLQAGDRAGLLGFDKDINLFREPRGGLGSFPGLHTASARLDYSTEETNFTLSLARLSTRLRQRSLVVLMTDFVDSIGARFMAENLQRLSRKHLVLFVTIRNPELEEASIQRPDTIRGMARSVVAADILQEREKVLKELRRYGIQTIDAQPGQISPELLNRYLEIKRREQIA